MPELSQQWNAPPIELDLSEHEVHVWRASLSLPVSNVQKLQYLLSEEELTKASRFHFERDRNHFIVAHGVLRTIIGCYLGTDPKQLRFCHNAYGKPSLFAPLHENKPKLSFNLSHSHELALYAFTYARQVGIDVEYMRSDIEYEQLASHSFSLYENAVFQALPETQKRQGFYNCWTRKEAYIKARGKGVSIPLDLFDVSLKPGERATLLNSREDPKEINRWSLREIDPGPGYAGALAVEGSGWQLHCWQCVQQQ